MSNKDLVRAAMTELYSLRDLSAINRYWHPAFIPHSPGMPSGLSALRAFVHGLPEDFRYEPGLVLEDGEFVMIHGRRSAGEAHASICIDIFRIDSGRLMEHWDVIQEEVLPEMTESRNPMFPILSARGGPAQAREIRWESTTG